MNLIDKHLARLAIWTASILAGLGLIGLVCFVLPRQQKPQVDDVLINRMRAELRLGQRDIAVQRLDRSLNQYAPGTRAVIRGWLALCDQDLGEAQRAVDEARRAGRAPELQVTRLADCVFAASDHSIQAEARLVRLLEKSQEPEPEACAALAGIFLKTYRLRLAQIVLERWARDDPRDPRPYIWMTEIDERSETGPANAVDHLREALKRDPGHAEARKKLADALRAADRYPEALEQFNALLQDFPRDENLIIGRARTHLALGHTEAAERDLRTLYRRGVEKPIALRELASIELTQGNPGEALTHLDRAIELDPFDAESHYRRATALERLNRRDDAAASKGRAAQLRADEKALHDVQRQFNANPKDLALRCWIARWMFEHGQPKQGVRWAETALAIDPTHPEANRLLSEHYRQTGDAARANYHAVFVQPKTGARGL